MITSFRAGDALRCMLVNAPGGVNLAAPTESVVRCRPLRNSTLWRQTLPPNHHRVTVGDWSGTVLSGLASARIRSGVRAWEVDRLHLRDLDQALELLELLAGAAGAHGAERVFLRVACDGEVVDAARRTGFFPCYEELHLNGQGWAGSPNAAGRRPGISEKYTEERPALPDRHGMFQLYCAATPQQVKEGVGLTLDQWADSQEQPRRRRDETVIKIDGKVVGWRMREPFGAAAAGQALAHPGHPGVLAHLIEMSQKTPNWLVPSYQKNAIDLLTRLGLHEAGRYIMLIKRVTAPVVNRELSYVEA